MSSDDNIFQVFGDQLYAYACPIPQNACPQPFESPIIVQPVIIPPERPSLPDLVIEQTENVKTLIEKCKKRITELNSIIEKAQEEKNIIEKMIEAVENTKE